MTSDRYTLFRPSFERQATIDAFAALPESHLMVALLELDVTDALAAIAALQQKGIRLSLFAFLVRSIAMAIAEHPDLNLVRHGKRLVRFEDVDVNVPVEVTTPEGVFPHMLILRGAQRLSPLEIYARIEGARESDRRSGDTSADDRWSRRMMRLFGWLPRFLRIAILRFFMRSAFVVKRRGGTTLVTSVGKFASIPGFAFTFSTGPRAAAFAVGSTVDRPWVHQGIVAVRTILGISLMVNHDLVDGGPAARFARRLQEIIESAEGLEQAPVSTMKSSSGHADPGAPPAALRPPFDERAKQA